MLRLSRQRAHAQSGRGSTIAVRLSTPVSKPHRMASFDSDDSLDTARNDLVAFLAQQLGVSQEVALARLGDWLVNFEPRAQPQAKRPPPNSSRGT